MPRYKVTAICVGLSKSEGAAAPSDIIAEFAHRPWHQKPVCMWQDSKLTLVVENDYDQDGSALLDEFWDAVIACIQAHGPIQFAVSAETIGD